ncbi:RHS repeat domain-containing protein [Haliscomenobacter sp.]|uniref:RHS repeat domain-containing protein n=1 Tax=Haliscomenobacter sp. TaxID=2717303 RepID=UPI0039B6FF71
MTSSTNYDHKSIKYTYDLQGNRASLTDPDGITNKFEYDSRNRLSSIVLNGKDTSRYQYHHDNLLKKTIYPNGTVLDRSMDGAYDRADRQKIILNTNRTRGDTISAYVYQYDANGNRSSQLELQKAFNRGLPETTLYKYDQLNRLIAVEYGKNGTSGKVSYTYSKNGNRLSEAGQDPTNQLKPINRQYNYDYANRLRSITNKLDLQQSTYFNYDSNGNRTSKTIGNIETKVDNIGRPVIRIITAKDSTTYKYGIRDELLQSTTSKNELTLFDYDYNQMRIKKTSKLQVKHYLYDFENSLLEYGQNGITQIKYNYGNNLLSLVQTSNGVKDQQFYLFDGLGSISNLTDSTNQNKYSYQYDAWGGKRNSQGSSSNAKNYTGHYYDEDVNLHYFGARYYEDDFGTFISQDPYLGELQTPLSLNRYLYAYANPLRYIDLNGYQSKEVTPHREIKTIDLEGETFYYRKGENGEIEITNTGFGLTENDVVIKESRSNLGEPVKSSSPSDEHPTPYDLQAEKDYERALKNLEEYYEEKLAKSNLDIAASIAKLNKLKDLNSNGSHGEKWMYFVENWAQNIAVAGENPGGWGQIVAASLLHGTGQFVAGHLDVGVGTGRLIAKLDVEGNITGYDYLAAGLDVLQVTAIGGAVYRGVASASKLGNTGSIISKTREVSTTGKALITVPKALNPGINITDTGLSHVLDRHTINNISRWAGKSKFSDASEVPDLIRQATQHLMIRQENGRFARIVNAGRIIGIDRATGRNTSIYTVITKLNGNLVTAFPGRP